MIPFAYDSNGNIYYAHSFKSSAEAHARKYFDKYGRPVTPVISNEKTPHFRHLKISGGGVSNGVSLEHTITQELIAYRFSNYETFWVLYYHRRPDGTLKGHLVDLKKYYDTCIIEGSIDKRRADILLKNSRDSSIKPIMIEVWYKHACEQAKIDEGNFIIEFKIKRLEDIKNYTKPGGLDESWISVRQPKVRYHNFRENWKDLPWADELEKLNNANE